MLWRVKTGTKLKTLDGHTSFVWSLAYVPGERGRFYLASASADTRLKLWNVDANDRYDFGNCIDTVEVSYAYGFPFNRPSSFVQAPVFSASCPRLEQSALTLIGTQFRATRTLYTVWLCFRTDCLPGEPSTPPLPPLRLSQPNQLESCGCDNQVRGVH